MPRQPAVRAQAPLAVTLGLAVVLGLVACSGTATPSAAGQPWTHQEAWSSGSQPVVYDAASGLLITLTTTVADTASTSAVTALSPSTGQQVWSVLTGDQVPQLAMPDGRLILVATSGPAQSVISPEGGPPSVWVIDSRSGTEVREFNLPADGSAIGMAGGRVISASQTALYAYSPVTGSRTWGWQPPHGCSLDSSIATGTTASVLTDCSGNVSLISIDPATGRTQWARLAGQYSYARHALPGQEFDPIDPYGIVGAQNIVGVTGEGTLSLYSASGTPLYSAETGLYDQPYFAAQGNQSFAVLTNPDGSGLTVLDVDIRNRTLRTLITAPYTPDSVALTDGTLYILAAPPPPLMPLAVIEVHVSGGSHSTLDLPFPSGNSVAGFDDLYSQSAIFYARGRLVVIPGTATIAAVSRGASDGRAPAAKRWLAPCSLLPSRAITDIAGDAYFPVPRQEPAQAGLPTASTCQYIPRDKGFPVITVGIGWQARTAADASELMRNSMQAGHLQNVTGICPNGSSCEVATADDALGNNGVLLRAGPVIASISFSAPFRRWRQVAALVSANLSKEAAAA